MADEQLSIDMKWYKDQVRQYKKLSPLYDSYAEVLEKLLKEAVKPICPTAIVTSRPKSVRSFAEKIIRKGKYEDYRGTVAAEKMTDLCGARVIVHLESEVAAICTFIREHFHIDEANSMDAAERLKADQFGYRSVHFIVSPKAGAFPTDQVHTRIPRKLFKHKAEVQVRTVVQHAWSDIGHDRLYKSAMTVPPSFIRDSARIAALLESSDGAFSRMAAGIDALQTNVGAYMSEADALAEIERVKAVRLFDKSNSGLVLRLARLLISLARWKQVIDLLTEFPVKDDPGLLSCLGYAMCRSCNGRTNTAKYRRGQRYLEEVVQASPGDVEALTNLAETWVRIDRTKAFNYYKLAFDADPNDPRALARFLRYQIATSGNLDIVSLVRPNIEAAIAKCRQQAEAGVNLPWALFYIAEFKLLLIDYRNRPRQPRDVQYAYESLAACARAISLSTAAHMIDDAITALNMLKPLRLVLPEIEWGRRLLMLAKAARYRKGRLPVELKNLASKRPLKGPVLIVAGGCDPAFDHLTGKYRRLLRAGLAEYRGTVISGGTKQGIPGMVGAIAKASNKRIHAIGYLPASLSTGETITKDTRYNEIRRTDGEREFNAIEPLQNWIDILASGIDPAEVTLLGINGGTIAGFEYRLAAALGAKVGVVRRSGREADRLRTEEPWEQMPGIVFLPADPQTLNAFVHHSRSHAMNTRDRNRIARAIHEKYCQTRLDSQESDDPSLAKWPKLSAEFKESNRRQADDISRKLASIGLQAVRVAEGAKPKLVKFTPQQIARFSEMEHGRWNVERILDGWTVGPHDTEKKTRPSLVPWKNLDRKTRQFDIDAVKQIPTLLASIGYEIRTL